MKVAERQKPPMGDMITELAAARVNPRTTEGPLSALESDVWRGFLRTHARVQRELDKEMMDAEGLRLSACEVLVRLAEAPESRMRMSDIAGTLLFSRSGITRMVDELERRGYVLRERISMDARGIDAVLTESGKAVVRRAQPVHLAGVRTRFLERLSDDQLRQLAGTWAVLDTTTAELAPTAAAPQSLRHSSLAAYTPGEKPG